MNLFRQIEQEEPDAKIPGACYFHEYIFAPIPLNPDPDAAAKALCLGFGNIFDTCKPWYQNACRKVASAVILAAVPQLVAENEGLKTKLLVFLKAGYNHYCPGESGQGEYSHLNETVPCICHYCREPNKALLNQRIAELETALNRILEESFSLCRENDFTVGEIYEIASHALNRKAGEASNLPTGQVREIHNPDNLTEWGQAERYRLLDKDEVIAGGRRIGVVQRYVEGEWKEYSQGTDSLITYRTKLTRAELRKARNLPPEPEQATVPLVTAAGKTPGEVFYDAYEAHYERGRDKWHKSNEKFITANETGAAAVLAAFGKERELEEAWKKINELQAVLESTCVDANKAEAELSTVKGRLGNCQTQLTERRIERDDAIDAKKEFAKMVDSLRTQLSEANAELNKLREFYNEIVAELGDDLVLRRIMNLQSQLATTEQTNEAQRQSLKSYIERIASLEQQLAALQPKPELVPFSIERWNKGERDVVYRNGEKPEAVAVLDNWPTTFFIRSVLNQHDIPHIENGRVSCSATPENYDLLMPAENQKVKELWLEVDLKSCDEFERHNTSSAYESKINAISGGVIVRIEIPAE